jgi:hypothetical protein
MVCQVGAGISLASPLGLKLILLFFGNALRVHCAIGVLPPHVVR